MITLLYIVGWIAMTIVVGFLWHNKILTNAYNKRLVWYRNNLDGNWRKGLNEAETELEMHKRALDQAEDDTEINRQIVGMLCGMGWPVTIVPLLGWYLYDGIAKLFNLSNLRFMPSKAERQIAKLEKAVRLENTRQHEWVKMIEEADAMGIDTSELKKI